MSRAVTCSFVALLCVPCAFGQTERKPTGYFPNAYPRWLAYTSPDSKVAGGILRSYLDGLSVAVDPRNVVHVVAIERDPARPEHRLLYFTTRFDTRRSNGFSAAVELDRAIAGSEAIARPDVAVHSDFTVHVVWERTRGSGATEVFYRQKSAAGWQPSQPLIPAAPSERYVMPQIAVDNSGRAHVTYAYTAGGSTHAFHEVVGVYRDSFIPNVQPVLPAGPSLPGTMRMALVPGLLDDLWLVWEGAFQTGVFYARRTAVGWNLPVQFGAPTERAPDVAVDSTGAPHAVWVGTGNRILHRQNWGATTQVNLLADAYGSARVLVDSRDQVHVLYRGLRYAAKVKNPNPNQLSPTWYRQEPIANPTQGLVVMADPWEAAITQNDRVHVVDAARYTATMVYDVGGSAVYRAAPLATRPAGLRDAPASGDCLEEPQAPFMQRTLEIRADPVQGALGCDVELFKTCGVGPTQQLVARYSNLDAAQGFLAPGWRFHCEWHLIDQWTGLNDPADAITLCVPGERCVPFVYSSARGYHVAADEYGYYASLQRTSILQLDADYLLTTKHGVQLTFDGAGRLQRILEPTGNHLDLTYDPQGLLVAITDMLGNGGPGRTATIGYEPPTSELVSPRALTVTDPGGAVYDFGYVGQQLRTLTLQSAPQAPTFGFDYYATTNAASGARRNLLSQIRDPEGQAALPQYGTRISYYPDDRLLAIDDPAERYLLDSDGDGTPPQVRVARWSVQYAETAPDTAPRLVTITDRRNLQTILVTEPRRDLVLEVRDPAVQAGTPGIVPVLLTYDPTNRNLTALRDRRGFVSSFTYHTVAVPAQVRDNVHEVFRPRMTGTGQDLVMRLVYTSDGRNRVDLLTTFATPPEGSLQTRITDFTWDTAGRLIRIRHPDVLRPDGTAQTNVVTQLFYAGPRGQLSHIVDEEGGQRDFANCDSRHGLFQTLLRQGGTQPETFAYDAMGHLVQHVRPRGGLANAVPGPTILNRDALYRIATVTDPSGLQTVFGYDRASRLTALQPPGSIATTVVYDKRGFPAGGSGPDGTWSQLVDANGNVSRFVNARGIAANFDYDALDRLAEQRVPGASTLPPGQGGGGPALHVTRLLHDGYDGGLAEHFATITQVGQPSDRVSRFVYNPRGSIAELLEPDGATRTRFRYDEQGHEIASELYHVATLQTATVTFRDARDRVVRERLQDTPLGVTPVRSASHWFLHDKRSLIVRVVDPLGDVTNPADPSHKTTVMRDARGRITDVVDGKGVVVRQSLWGDDDLEIETRVPDPATKTTALVTERTYSYTARKELEAIRNRNGAGSTFQYDALPDQRRTETHTSGIVNRTTYYPGTQRVDEVIVAEGTPDESRSKLDWSGRLLVAKRTWNPATRLYDAVTSFAYDQADRLERRAGPVVSAERIFYDDFGLMSRLVNGSRTATLGHDALGQLLTTAWSGAFTDSMVQSWDGAGNLTSFSDGTLQVMRAHDAWIGAPTTETFVVSATTFKAQVHGFDIAGNYRSLVDPEGNLHEWEVDENNRVWRIKYRGVVLAERTYTPGGLLDRTTLHNAVGAEIARITETYDGLGRLVRRHAVRQPSGTTLTDHVFGYDTLDRPTTITWAHVGLAFTLGYDRRDQLVSETTPGNFSVPARAAAWTYDPGGNRLTQTLQGIQTDYAYDAAGRLVEERTPATARRVTRTYDEWGNQRTVRTVEGTNPILFHDEVFAYDALDRLVSYGAGRALDAAASGWRYAYWPTGDRYSKTDLATSRQELWVPRFGDVVAEYSRLGSGPVQLDGVYVQDTGIDAKLARIAANGQRRHYLTDLVGTVVAQLGDAGALVQHTVRDAWGNKLSAGPVSGRYGFTQREEDPESRLVHVRRRHYDPRIGRFVQMDPKRANRAAKAYTYAANSPARLVDPFGEDEIPVGTLTGRGLRDLASASACAFVDGLLGSSVATDAVLTASLGRSVQPRLDGLVLGSHTTPDLLAGLVDSLTTALFLQDKQDDGLGSIIDLIKSALGQNDKIGKAFDIIDTIQTLIKQGKFKKADAIEKLTSLLDLLDAVAGGDISKVTAELLKWVCLLENNGVMKLPMKDKFVIAGAAALEKWWDGKSDKEKKALKEHWQKIREKLGEIR
jgi:RHS repeat-associated protein